ncbi:MAG: ABC transporter substrate-binding protein [Alphaproteobacteria bacterium]|nr:MAG: ABC transporter substrate-binding protein [Alphaproteobacteria bacterium]
MDKIKSFVTVLFFCLSTNYCLAQSDIISHGISTFGDLKYEKDFKHLSYVNPDAPKGGEISFWAFGSFDSMHPYTRKGRAGAYSSIFFESLLEGTADEIDSAYGLIAKEIEYPEDRSWVIFTLRNNVTFSDGSPLTAQDVLFSYYLLKQKGLPSFRAVLEKDVKNAELISDLKIKFTFNDDVPKRDLINTVGGLPIFSEKYFTDNKVDFEASTLTPALGSGPYILDKVDVGKQIIYKKNATYWGNDLPINKGRYNFNKFRIEYFADYNSAFEGFKAGTYTFRNEASSKIWATGYDFPALEKNWVKKTTLPDGNLSSGQSFVINLRREKFQNIKVRKAIGLMFNFEWSNSTLFYGLYERINSFWDNSDLKASGLPTNQELQILSKYKSILDANNFSEEVFTFPKSSLKQLDRKNLRQASKLLDDAGWEVSDDGLRRNAEGKTLDIEILNDSQAFDRIINPYIENLKKLGINAVNTKIDNAQMTDRRRKFDFDILVGFLSTQLTPGSELEQYFGSESADFSIFNLTGIKDQGVDAIIKEVRAAESREQLGFAIRALDRILRNKVIWVPQWFKNKHTIAYYDMYEHPKALPQYDIGVLDTWWINSDKYSDLKEKGALK